MLHKKPKADLILQVPIIVSSCKDRPFIELRRVIKDQELIKAIVSCAYHEQPIQFVPKFTDKLKSLNSLIENGIVIKDAEGNYYFTL